MGYTKTDIKSPRDLCLHLEAFSSPKTKAEIEENRNDARNFGGPSPVTPDGAHSLQGIEDFLGTCKDF